MQASWRPLTETDLAEVHRLAAAAHPDMGERLEVFAEKFRLYPEGCFALDLDGAVRGYLISHPWRLWDAPALDSFLGALPSAPDCLYLHDLALAPEARGRGAAAAVIERAAALAAGKGLADMALVSVRGTGAFWAHAGFRDAPDPRLAAKLATYGADARYRVRRIGALTPE